MALAIRGLLARLRPRCGRPLPAEEHAPEHAAPVVLVRSALRVAVHETSEPWSDTSVAGDALEEHRLSRGLDALARSFPGVAGEPVALRQSRRARGRFVRRPPGWRAG